MIIELKREVFNTNNTIGSININNTIYYTLEDVVRFPEGSTLKYMLKNKVKHQTAIPYGTYEIVWTYSNKFERFMPELLNVPAFGGIRMHKGNVEANTSGCVLLGKRKTKDSILGSKSAVKEFEKWLLLTMKKEKVFIKITK
jgi:hypothetical protein